MSFDIGGIDFDYATQEYMTEIMIRILVEIRDGQTKQIAEMAEANELLRKLIEVTGNLGPDIWDIAERITHVEKLVR